MSEPVQSATPRWQNWLLNWPGLATAFVWGVAEGSFFFLIPDIVITLAVLFSVKKSVCHMLLVVVGSLVAGAGLFAWSQHDYGAAKRAVERVPFVRERMFEKTEADFSRLGVGALFAGPMEGIPYKVYAVQAPSRCSLPVFLLASVPARLERLIVSWIVFALVGWALRHFGVRTVFAVVFHAGYWLAVYAYYWSVI